MAMNDSEEDGMGFAEDLHSTVAQAALQLNRLTPEQAATPPAPGRWSPIQIIGHLIDSASNNHGRFVRAQLTEDLCFEGYDQEGWVEAQRWAEADWQELVALWEAFNLQIARLMAITPTEALRRPRANHNLDRLAWETVPADQPATLEYFMRDYLGHLKHHLRQIDPDLAGAPELQGGGGGIRRL